MVERRKIPRSRTYLGGTIAFNGRASAIDCIVRNLSSDGAMVAFDNTASVPDRFELLIARKSESFGARAVWRSFNKVGLAFVTESGTQPVPIEWARRLRAAEDRNKTLRQRVDQLTSE